MPRKKHSWMNGKYLIEAIPRKQRFFSYLALSVNEVVFMACLSHSWHVTDKPRERLCNHYKP